MDKFLNYNKSRIKKLINPQDINSVEFIINQLKVLIFRNCKAFLFKSASQEGY